MDKKIIIGIIVLMLVCALGITTYFMLNKKDENKNNSNKTSNESTNNENERNDNTKTGNGKTVIPFCTSSSSGLGESGELLAKETGTGNWVEGHRFSSNPSSNDIKSFTDSLK